MKIDCLEFNTLIVDFVCLFFLYHFPEFWSPFDVPLVYLTWSVSTNTASTVSTGRPLALVPRVI